ncbi:hypothetical protein ACI77J_28890 [Pseudomonas sp. O64]|uniref:hypothetical protein n=1 Tax=unclassified Pseudomonas TaxID=196821 RepID=UPI001F56E80B|nr:MULTISPECIES: hypothetical protein [unclassified Pseudomonas]UNM18176.1 hypothetical protein K0P33_21895 [Pseudomonas sp. ArH3a]UXZ20961.1 hypothetical protein KZH41_21000 [Pseudomonas sp. YeP6b]
MRGAPPLFEYPEGMLDLALADSPHVRRVAQSGFIPLVSNGAVILLIQGVFRFEHVGVVLRLVDKKVGEQRYPYGRITLNPAIKSLYQTDHFITRI